MKFRIIFFLTLIFALSSCDIAENRTMDVAEKLMDEKPDSALALMKSIDPLTLRRDLTNARYALLYSQALDKNYINEHNDSLIRIAVDYYDAKEDSREKMLAYYYLARVNENNENNLQTLKACLEARRIAEKIENYYYLGLVCSSISKAYSRTHYYTDALKAIDLTIDAFQKAGKEEHLDWAHLDKASLLFAIDSLEQCRPLIESLREIVQKKQNTEFTRYYNNLAFGIIEKTEWDSIPTYFSRLIRPNGASYGALVNYFVHENQMDSAEYYIPKMTYVDSPQLQAYCEYVKAEYEYKKGEKDQAYERLVKALKNYIDVYNNYAQSGLTVFETDFYKEETQREKTRAEYERKGYLSLTFSIVILCLAGFFYFRRKIGQKQEEISMAIETAATLQKEIMNNQQVSNEQKSKIRDLLHAQFNDLSNLCMSYYETPTEKRETSSMAKKVQDIIMSFRQKEKMQEIVNVVNEENDKVLTHLFEEAREKNVVFNDRESALLIFLIAGFPPTTISVLLELSISNYYTLKSRLKNKLQTLATKTSLHIFETYF